MNSISNFFLKKIRLTYYFVFFFVVYLFLSFAVEDKVLDKPLLTLFSANSFLYGFYISPIIKGQESRLMTIAKAIRQEANTLFASMLKLRGVSKRTKHKVLDLVRSYLNASIDQKNVAEGEAEYEQLISYLVEYDGEDRAKLDDVLKDVADNQKNRSELSMNIGSGKVYRNEWIVMLMLFGVTIFFVLVIDTQGQVLFNYVQALICTALTMLVVILVKMSTLTHKRAKDIWQPFKNLIDSGFHRID